MSPMWTTAATVAQVEPDAAAWDAVVQASNAPLFYRSEVLRAYRRSPLRETLATFQLTERSGPAVLPAFLLPAEDPLGVLGDLLPSYRPAGPPLLLSHVWHWYDTHLPALRLTAELVERVCGRLHDLATSCGAQAFGFVNVSAGSAFADLLARVGLDVRPIDARYDLDLHPYRTVEHYLAGLRPRVRQEMRRHLRLAERTGATVTVGPPGPADMAAVAALCRAAAAKHGNAGWYLDDRLESFVLRLRRHVRLVAIRIDGEPVAASISFVDGTRFHNWAAGTVPLHLLPFSPYQVLMHATIRAALDEGCVLLEGGRRNDGWKERLGFRRRVLVGTLVAA
jgi:Acetyltransferase (GNAT) domain